MLGLEMRNLVLCKSNRYGNNPGLHESNERIHWGDGSIDARVQDDSDETVSSPAKFSRN